VPPRRSILTALGAICILGFATVDLRASAPPTTRPFLLHLPGIGGHMRIDDLVTQGIVQGGLVAEVRIYDWTNGNPGMPALAAYDRNRQEAERIAQVLKDLHLQDPTRKIILSGHSGGAGLAVWALEELPEDVHIDTLLMIAPALSPEYDLSKALRRVSGQAYAFTSTLDPILSFGTRSFGTIDRVKCDAAGHCGFAVPQNALDAGQYRKLRGIAYDSTWLKYGNAGDHIGAMMRPFARAVLAPLLLTGELPPKRSPMTTRPSTFPATVE
jgi:pimeloyl-ACP methyl ester carboxylesterase